MKKNKGFFISFEGGEGAGKTTLINNLQTSLEKKGFEVLVAREPGGTEFGEKVRSLLLESSFKMTAQAELCLFLASRSQHISEKLRPALEEGKVVLCDRFNESSIAYQGAGRKMGMDLVSKICETICNGFSPDLTFFLDIPPEKGLGRIEAKHDRIESEKQSFHEKVRQGYLTLAQNDTRIVVIDATLSKEKVFEKAMKVLENSYLSNSTTI